MASIKEVKGSKKGAYRITVSNGYDMNGKQIKVSTNYTPDPAKTRKQQLKEAEEYAFEFEKKVKEGRLYNGDKISFADFTEEWLEKEAKVNLEKTTIYCYQRNLRNTILPALGKYKMTKITPVLLERYFTGLLQEGAKQNGLEAYSMGTVKRDYTIISSIMRTAVRWNVIEENPCKRAQLPRERVKDNNVKHFTLEQAKTFLNILDKPSSVYQEGKKIVNLERTKRLHIQFVIFFRIALLGGLRRGELIALTWADIDFQHSKISINKSAGHIDQGQITKSTKTVQSNRDIVLPQSEMELLGRWKTEQKNLMLAVGSKWEGYRGSEYEHNNVFIQTNQNYGRAMNIATPYKKFVGVINSYNRTVENEEDKLPVIPLHGLRHTFATLQISLGTDVKTTQSMLGHASIQTTLNTYAHALEDKQREASNALGTLLNRQA